jgi:hypothetical protein
VDWWTGGLVDKVDEVDEVDQVDQVDTARPSPPLHGTGIVRHLLPVGIFTSIDLSTSSTKSTRSTTDTEVRKMI